MDHKSNELTGTDIVVFLVVVIGTGAIAKALGLGSVASGVFGIAITLLVVVFYRWWIGRAEPTDRI
jgi:hypothetical protein